MILFFFSSRRRHTRCLSDWSSDVCSSDLGGATPNPNTMLDFNLFTFNGRAFPGTAPLVVKKGQRVRVRLANLSMDSHPIHIHGVHFVETGTDGGPVPPSAQLRETTVNVPPGA